MQLEIVSPERQVYAGEVDLVQLPGTMGLFEILNNHAPLIATLERGKIKIIDYERNMFYIEITGGVVRVENNQITVVLSANG